LGGLGYSVVLKNDLNHRDMGREIDAFIDRLKSNKNSEGFFWYAGHGIPVLAAGAGALATRPG